MPKTEFSDRLHSMKHRGTGEDYREAMHRVSFGLKDDDNHYHALRSILLQMRYLFGGRIQTAIGSLREVTAYNCFVSGSIADSFVDGPGSIMARAHEAAATMRMGGGIGYDFSTLRPTGALIKRLQSHSSGPISFMRIFNEICLCTASSGHRRGAQMGIMRVDHPDIETFIRAKQNTEDFRGFNLSIALTNDFMEAALTEKPFDLRFNGEVYSTIDAAALWEMIMRSTWDWGEPGAIFIDTINEMNNLHYCEEIAATNPCFTGDTKVVVAGRGSVPLKTLAEEGKDVPVFACDTATGETVVRWGRNPRLTQKNAPILKITLDDGSSLRTTWDHKFPLRDGRVVTARDLIPGDSLFRFDSTTSSNGTVRIGGKKEYHLIAESKYGRKFNWGTGRGQYHAHHMNGNHFDNHWNNIEVKFAEDHNSDHKLGDANPMRFWWQSISDEERDIYRARMSLSTSGERNGMWGREHSIETRAAIREKTKARAANEDYRIRFSEAVRKAMTPERKDKIKAARKKMFITVEKICLECQQGFSYRADPKNARKIMKKTFCSVSCGVTFKNKSNRGIPLSAERRATISKQQKDRPHSAEHNAKVAIAMRNHVKSAAHRAALSVAAKNRTDLTRNSAGQYVPLNHKVVSVEPDGFEDVYNITVDEFHNLAIATSEGTSQRYGNPTVSGIYVRQCGEQPLPPYGACLLGSFNLPQYLVPTTPHDVDRPSYRMDFDQLRADIPPIVRAMDNVVDRARYPLPQHKAEAITKRRMGIGVTGLANALEACGHPYGTEDFLTAEKEILGVIRDEAYRSSARLAAEKGAFPLYDQERYLQGAFIKTLPDDIKDLIRRHGIRNSHLTSIAPAGTISMAADCVSSGLEPVYEYATDREINTPDGKYAVRTEDYGVKFLGVKGVRAHEVTAQQHVAVQAAAQSMIDSAVSKTVNMDSKTMNWHDFKALYQTAWESGCKGCATFNASGKRMGLLQASEDSNLSCQIDTETGRMECA